MRVTIRHLSKSDCNPAGTRKTHWNEFFGWFKLRCVITEPLDSESLVGHVTRRDVAQCLQVSLLYLPLIFFCLFPPDHPTDSLASAQRLYLLHPGHLRSYRGKHTFQIGGASTRCFNDTFKHMIFSHSFSLFCSSYMMKKWFGELIIIIFLWIKPDCCYEVRWIEVRVPSAIFLSSETLILMFCPQNIVHSTAAVRKWFIFCLGAFIFFLFVSMDTNQKEAHSENGICLRWRFSEASLNKTWNLAFYVYSFSHCQIYTLSPSVY